MFGILYVALFDRKSKKNIFSRRNLLIPPVTFSIDYLSILSDEGIDIYETGNDDEKFSIQLTVDEFSSPIVYHLYRGQKTVGVWVTAKMDINFEAQLEEIMYNIEKIWPNHEELSKIPNILTNNIEINVKINSNNNSTEESYQNRDDVNISNDKQKKTNLELENKKENRDIKEIEIDNKEKDINSINTIQKYDENNEKEKINVKREINTKKEIDTKREINGKKEISEKKEINNKKKNINKTLQKIINTIAANLSPLMLSTFLIPKPINSTQIIEESLKINIDDDHSIEIDGSLSIERISELSNMSIVKVEDLLMFHWINDNLEMQLDVYEWDKFLTTPKAEKYLVEKSEENKILIKKFNSGRIIKIIQLCKTPKNVKELLSILDIPKFKLVKFLHYLTKEQILHKVPIKIHFEKYQEDLIPLLSMQGLTKSDFSLLKNIKNITDDVISLDDCALILHTDPEKIYLLQRRFNNAIKTLEIIKVE